MFIPQGFCFICFFFLFSFTVSPSINNVTTSTLISSYLSTLPAIYCCHYPFNNKTSTISFLNNLTLGFFISFTKYLSHICSCVEHNRFFLLLFFFSVSLFYPYNFFTFQHFLLYLYLFLLQFFFFIYLLVLVSPCLL